MLYANVGTVTAVASEGSAVADSDPADILVGYCDGPFLGLISVEATLADRAAHEPPGSTIATGAGLQVSLMVRTSVTKHCCPPVLGGPAVRSSTRMAYSLWATP